VRHHLLLPHTATRRDLDDDATVRRVVDTVGGDAGLLELLHALAEADALATGPGVWSDWKSALVAELVERCRAFMAGSAAESGAESVGRLGSLGRLGSQPLDERLSRLVSEAEAADGVRLVLDQAARPAVVTVVAPDRTGLLSLATGVLALHSLEVLSASIRTHEGTAVDIFEVSPRFGSLPDAALLRESLVRALGGSLALTEGLATKERDYASSFDSTDAPPPRVLWFDDEATGAVVMELRTHDRIGLLHRVAAALESCDADIRWAKAATLGRSVVDSFCIVAAGSTPAGTLDPAARRRIEHAVLTAAR
ncbi:MAG TPA: [protein-PII] uridylyltransferase, partial [Pseudonocardiaceae bacterium]